ncbi:MAG: flagellar hook-length control protein FliK [bacterium]|nr:flagellar hook-length control protein FliK [bacterium]
MNILTILKAEKAPEIMPQRPDQGPSATDDFDRVLESAIRSRADEGAEAQGVQEGRESRDSVKDATTGEHNEDAARRETRDVTKADSAQPEEGKGADRAVSESKPQSDDAVEEPVAAAAGVQVATGEGVVIDVDDPAAGELLAFAAEITATKLAGELPLVTAEQPAATAGEAIVAEVAQVPSGGQTATDNNLATVKTAVSQPSEGTGMTQGPARAAVRATAQATAQATDEFGPELKASALTTEKMPAPQIISRTAEETDESAPREGRLSDAKVVETLPAGQRVKAIKTDQVEMTAAPRQAESARDKLASSAEAAVAVQESERASADQSTGKNSATVVGEVVKETRARIRRNPLEGGRTPEQADKIEGRTPISGGGKSPVEMVPVDAEIQVMAPKTDEGTVPNEGPAIRVSGDGLTVLARGTGDTSSGFEVAAAPKEVVTREMTLERLPNHTLRIVENLREDGGHDYKATVRLDPAELGQMRIEIKLENERLHARFVVESAVARDKIQGELPRLRDVLSSQGLEEAMVEVHIDQGSSGETGSEFGGRSDEIMADDGISSDEETMNDNMRMRTSGHDGRIDIRA